MSGVMGFSEISYDELMDVNGGCSLYGEKDTDGIRVGLRGDNWQAEVGFNYGSGPYFKFDASF